MANEVATARVNPMVQFRAFFDERAIELKHALPAHISPDQFIRVILTMAQINPDLIQCTKQSLWTAAMRAAHDGLLPDGTEAAIVPYKDRATYVPMYQGLLKKFRNSGEFKTVSAGIVYEGEFFERWIDETGEHFKHVPGDERDTKKIRRVYATATTKSGGFFFTDLSMSEINKHRAMSRTTRDDSPWNKWFEAMALKTAIKVASKFWPKSSDVDTLIRRDEEELLGIESIEERRQERRTQSVGAMDALRQFGGETESADAEDQTSAPEQQQEAGESQTESAATSDPGGTRADQQSPNQTAEEGRASVVSDTAAKGKTQPTQPTQPKTPAEYFSYAEAMANEMIANNDGEVEQARKWFNSDAQRKMRKAIGIEVDTVIAFSERMFGK